MYFKYFHLFIYRYERKLIKIKYDERSIDSRESYQFLYNLI